MPKPVRLPCCKGWQYVFANNPPDVIREHTAECPLIPRDIRKPPAQTCGYCLITEDQWLWEESQDGEGTLANGGEWIWNGEWWGQKEQYFCSRHCFIEGQK